MGKEKEEKVYALFDILLIVELQQDIGGKTTPFISYRYPQFEKFEKDPFSSSVTQFCFPDINQFPTETMESEKFSFVLTEGDGEKRFGYCIRKLPPGNGPRYPLAFSIMAFFPCFTLYTKILEEVMYHYENTSLRMLSDFLCTVLANPFPLPGNSFEVKIGNSQQPNSTKFTRPDDSDSQIDHVDLDTLLLSMNERNILTIFSSMLIERRIIFCSSKLSSLSSCIQTAVALLYPFTWQHIYIPVLPKSLLSFCCAPMPFVVGILASELNEVLMLPMDEVLIINLDEDCFIRLPDPEMNDLDYLPLGSIDNLKKSLKDTCRMIKKYQKMKKANKSDDMGDKVMEYELKKQKGELKENFLQFFVYFLGSYKSYITNNIFDRDAFIADQTPDTKPFVTLLCTSQMFERFLEERIHSQISSGGFERAVSRFGKFAELSTQIMEDEKGISKRNVKKNHVIYGLKSLRGFISKSESPTEVNELTLSTPTLVQSTNDRIVAENDDSNQKTPPPPPPKPSVNKLKMFVPNKTLPSPPPQQSSRPPSALLNALDVANDMAQTNKEKRESRSSSTRHHSPLLYQRNEFNSDGNITVIAKPIVNNKNNSSGNIINNHSNSNSNNNNSGSSLKNESTVGKTGGSKRELSRSFSDKSLTESLQMMAASAPPVPPSRQLLTESGNKESLYLTKSPRPELNKAEPIPKQMTPPVGRGVGERGGLERGGTIQINSPISRRDRGGLERTSDRGSDRGALVKATGERGSDRGGVEKGGLERGGRGVIGERGGIDRGGLERGGIERGGMERGDRGLMRGSPRRVQPVQRVGQTPPVPGARGVSPAPVRTNSPVVPPNRGPSLIPSPDRSPISNISNNISNNINTNTNIIPPVNSQNNNTPSSNNNNSSRGSSVPRGGVPGVGSGSGRVVVLGRGHSHSASRPLPTPPP